MICRICHYAIPDTSVYDYDMDGVLLVGVKCYNRKSNYYHSLLNISLDGDIYRDITWIGCELYKEVE